MGHDRRTRILIVDDSAVVRSLLRTVISADAALEVAATAADGVSALGILDSIHPDLVLLDLEMPNMDGLGTVRAIRARGYRMPVIIVSAASLPRARVTIEALANGATDYVTKPAKQTDRLMALQTLAQDLLPRIHALTAAPVASQIAVRVVEPPAPWRPVSELPGILVVGTSTGGPAALEAVLGGLPASFPVPVLIVQHMPEVFTCVLAEALGEHCHLRVREASDGMQVLPGNVYLARGNWHMEVFSAARAETPPTLHLHQGIMENHCRPAVDVLFRSAAAVYGAATLAVVLTGMGSDGLAGSRVICSRGGAVLAQNQETSVVWGMPRAVVQAGLAHRILPLSAIADEILRLVLQPGINARPTTSQAVQP